MNRVTFMSLRTMTMVQFLRESHTRDRTEVPTRAVSAQPRIDSVDVQLFLMFSAGLSLRFNLARRVFGPYLTDSFEGRVGRYQLPMTGFAPASRAYRSNRSVITSTRRSRFPTVRFTFSTSGCRLMRSVTGWRWA